MLRRSPATAAALADCRAAASAGRGRRQRLFFCTLRRPPRRRATLPSGVPSHAAPVRPVAALDHHCRGGRDPPPRRRRRTAEPRLLPGAAGGNDHSSALPGGRRGTARPCPPAFRPMPRRLDPLLRPASIVVVGATRRHGAVDGLPSRGPLPGAAGGNDYSSALPGARRGAVRPCPQRSVPCRTG